MKPLLLLGLMLVGVGCAERPAGEEGAPPPAEETNVGYTVRGVFQGPRYDGQAAAIDHEAIPDVMPAMRMDLRVADPALLDSLSAGDKIRFRMEDRGVGFVITEVERLPADTALDLASPVVEMEAKPGRPEPEAE